MRKLKNDSIDSDYSHVKKHALDTFWVTFAVMSVFVVAIIWEGGL